MNTSTSEEKKALLVNLYNFFFPAYENEVEGSGIDLNEMLSFLKMRA